MTRPDDPSSSSDDDTNSSSSHHDYLRLAGFLNRRRVPMDNTNSQNHTYPDFSSVSNLVRGIHQIHLSDYGNRFLPLRLTILVISPNPKSLISLWDAY